MVLTILSMWTDQESIRAATVCENSETSEEHQHIINTLTSATYQMSDIVSVFSKFPERGVAND